MMHRICDKCLEVESIDFGEMIDDAFYCTECYEEIEKEYENERKNTTGTSRCRCQQVN
jgi:hypothetical protein